MYQCTVLVYYIIEGAIKLKVNARHGKYATANHCTQYCTLSCTKYANVTGIADKSKPAKTCKQNRRNPQCRTDDETVRNTTKQQRKRLRNIFVKFKNTFRHGL